MASDHKFERKYDRQAILLDAKQRIIDLMDFQAQPPDVGIYDEPVRYFKANLEWCKFIFGFLSWAEHVAYWKDADDELHHAIQQILIFEEGIEGGVLMSPDEFKNALRDGLYEWSNNVAKQIVSGRYTNIIVDEDGAVSDPTTGGDANLPEDDPETVQDERSESKTGSAIRLANEINKFYARISGLFGVDVTPDRPVEDAIEWIENVYMRGETVLPFSDAMNEFWTRRAAAQPVCDFIPGLAEWLYCNGMTFDSVYEAIYTKITDTDAAANGVGLLGALDSDWFNLWIAEGSIIPSTDYRGYGCTPIPTEILTFDMSTANTVSKVTNGVWKQGHRYLIEAEGSYFDSDTPTLIGDAMYFHDTGTGTKTFAQLNFNFDGSITVPTQAGVPFASDHKYRYTIEKNVGSGNASRTVSRDNGTMNLPNVTGILTVKITDLGEFAD